MRSIRVVMIGRRHCPARAFILSDRPVLDVIVPAVDGTDLVAASVAIDCSDSLVAAGVVRAVVFENLC